MKAFSTIIIFVCLSLVGLAMLPLLSVKLSPSQTLPDISVSFSLPGSASRVVEMEVTSKLEAMLSRIKGLEQISSTSGNGWGSIQMRFDKHVNMDAVRFEVSSVIRQTWPHLPEEMSYPTVSLSRADDEAARPFLTYTLNAPAPPVAISKFAENNIKDKLSLIQGVNRIDVSGAMPMQWQLEYDAKALELLGVSEQDIQNAIRQSRQKEFLGIVNLSSDKTNWIRLALMPEKTDDEAFDPSRIAVTNREGKIFTLAQLVRVSHVEEEARNYFRINGLNSIYLSFIADDHANQLSLSRQIKSKLEELKQDFPAGYELHMAYDATEYIQKELDTIYFRTGWTLLILLLFVVLIYRNGKYVLLITLSLAMNIAVALIFYYFLGLEMQLYSLAGITISLSLIIDNIIVMSDQILHHRNKKAFLAILTATITTIASLVIIFFMDERTRLNLLDFAKVIMVNLTVSLAVALFLVPALMEKLNVKKRAFAAKNNPKRVNGRRLVLRINSAFLRAYAVLCRFLWRWRVAACLLLVLSFGLPVFMLPERMEGRGSRVELYNKTLGSTVYKEKVRQHVDRFLGGSLRLFSQKVYNGGYFTNREETSIYVAATLPNGSTIAQMNHLMEKMESYISQFKEVKQFQTTIGSARRASINILFTRESEKTGFPYVLKSKLISRSLELGGGSWTVVGLGDGFSNDVRETVGSYQVILKGYNYDELNVLAENFKDTLLQHRRIKEVTINSEFSYFKDDYREFVFDLNRERLAQEGLQPNQVFSGLYNVFARDMQVAQLSGEYGLEDIVLHSRESQAYNLWDMEHVPFSAGPEKSYKLSHLARVEKVQANKNVVKEDQQYRLCLQYEYIGAYDQGNKVLDRNIEAFRKTLPMGYSIENVKHSWDWGQSGGKQYALLLLIFVIIYFTCSILFNSLKQPWVILFVIPISFIGIFLTFYLFQLNFDQGGFASFILLCGISVNANIYLLDAYNQICRNRPSLPPLQAYLKAWNTKIVPIFLTVISTILGFIPFMVGEREAFWFPLAAGTIGGLIVSLIGIFLFLPLFLGVGKKR